MSNFLQHYWYIGLAFSALYTIGSVWWSLRVESKIKDLTSELRIQRLLQNHMSSDLNDVEFYISNHTTLRMNREVQ